MDKRDMVHTYNGTLHSHKKNEIMPFTAMWMELEIIILSEVSQKQEDKYHILLVTYIPHVTYMWNLKHDTNEFILQNRNRLTENRLWLPREGGWIRSFGLANTNYYMQDG